MTHHSIAMLADRSTTNRCDLFRNTICAKKILRFSQTANSTVEFA
jgi:hypothetical protein